MTFTGKSNVLNSKTQKYMFWIQKNKHLFFFSSYNVILEIHKERYPFVDSKSKAACVLTRGGLWVQGDTWTASLQRCRSQPAWHVSRAACRSCPSASRAAFSLGFAFLFWRAAEITVWIGAFCFRVLIANPIWLFGYMGLLLCRCSHSRSPAI